MKDITVFERRWRVSWRFMGRLLRQFAGPCGLVAVLVPVFALAQHQHGVMELNVAIDGRDLLLQLVAPMQDIAGFEHYPPRNEAEQRSLERGLGVVGDPRSVFSLPDDAKCKVRDVEIELPGEHHHADEPGGAHGDSGDEPPSGEAASGEPADAADGPVVADPHSDLIVNYQLSCRRPQNLASIRIHLFRLFPALTSIQANVITATDQTFQQLDFTNSDVNIPSTD